MWHLLAAAMAGPPAKLVFPRLPIRHDLCVTNMPREIAYYCFSQDTCNHNNKFDSSLYSGNTIVILCSMYVLYNIIILGYSYAAMMLFPIKSILPCPQESTVQLNASSLPCESDCVNTPYGALSVIVQVIRPLAFPGRNTEANVYTS